MALFLADHAQKSKREIMKGEEEKLHRFQYIKFVGSYLVVDNHYVDTGMEIFWVRSVVPFCTLIGRDI